jgi:hypothetical protein
VLAFLVVGAAPSRPAIASRVALGWQLSIWDWRRQIKFNRLPARKPRCALSIANASQVRAEVLNWIRRILQIKFA